MMTVYEDWNMPGDCWNKGFLTVSLRGHSLEDSEDVLRTLEIMEAVIREYKEIAGK